MVAASTKKSGNDSRRGGASRCSASGPLGVTTPKRSCCNCCASSSSSRTTTKTAGDRRTPVKRRPENVSQKKWKNIMKREKNKANKNKKKIIKKKPPPSLPPPPQIEHRYYKSDIQLRRKKRVPLLGYNGFRPVSSVLYPDAVQSAVFAVSKHNKKNQVKKLEFVKIVKAMAQFVCGFNYELIIMVREIDTLNLQIYEAKVWDNIPNDEKELVHFKKAPLHLLRGNELKA